MIKHVPLDGIPRDVWLAMRIPYINASEVPIVCGEDSWGSPAILYAEKKGLRPPKMDTGVLRRGRWGEAAVFEALAENYPEWEIVRAKKHVVDEDRRQACTPDGFARRPDRDGVGVIQAKVVAGPVFRDKWLDDPSAGLASAAWPPAGYMLQTLTEMKLNETSWGALAVLVLVGDYGDWTFRLFDVERDATLEARIDHNVSEFFRRYLDAGIMPPFDPQKDEALVKALYPRDAGTFIDLTTDNRAVALVEDLTETQAALKRLNAQEKELKVELQGKLGAHTFGLLPEGRCLSWKLQHRKAHAVEAADFRVLRIHKRTPEDITA